MEADTNDIIAGVLTLPRKVDAQWEGQRVVMDNAMLTSAASVRTDMEALAEAGDDVAAAVVRLFVNEPEYHSDLPMTFDTGLTPHVIYAAAALELDAGSPEAAVARLSLLLSSNVARADALCGLAIVSVMKSHYDDALFLANKCIELQAANPRALCIAGFCELRRGNRKVAQILLARVARVARKLPEFREDLRAAQRMLLNIHFT